MPKTINTKHGITGLQLRENLLGERAVFAGLMAACISDMSRADVKLPEVGDDDILEVEMRVTARQRRSAEPEGSDTIDELNRLPESRAHCYIDLAASGLLNGRPRPDGMFNAAERLLGQALDDLKTPEPGQQLRVGVTVSTVGEPVRTDPEPSEGGA